MMSEMIIDIAPAKVAPPPPTHHPRSPIEHAPTQLSPEIREEETSILEMGDSGSSRTASAGSVYTDEEGSDDELEMVALAGIEGNGEAGANDGGVGVAVAVIKRQAKEIKDLKKKMDGLKKRVKELEKEQMVVKSELDGMRTKFEEGDTFAKGLEKKIEDMIGVFNTDQLRMPARLHNATCHKSPSFIKPPPISPGKTPKNFPATRGEFEHLTRERYEGILNEYNVKHSGDVNEKRETLRAFLGLPVDLLKK